MLRPVKGELTFGKDPAGAVAREGIVATSLDGLKQGIQTKLDAIGDEAWKEVRPPPKPADHGEATDPLRGGQTSQPLGSGAEKEEPMLRRVLSFILTLVILQTFVPELPALAAEGEQGQSVEQMKKIVQKAIKKNKSVKVVLKEKHKYMGPVTEATDADFVVSDSKTATPVRLAFVDVKQVSLKGLPTAAKAAIVGGRLW